MAEAFKNLINADVVQQVGQHLHRVWPQFDQKAFRRLALTGLEDLEFKARAQHLSQALAHTLPSDFRQAADILESSLKVIPPVPADHDPDQELGSLQTDDTGLGGWALWAFGEYVAQQGIDHPERALQALHAITQRFTAEFAIRPFIVAHPALTLATINQWAHDPSAHVRRLASEGSRPRLPWGLRLQTLVQDPRPTLGLLQKLQDDPSEYVRRSVANHLNDIAKDHPELIVEWLQTHLPDAPATRKRLLRHACRTLIKNGHPGVMAAWGLGTPFSGQAQLVLNTQQVQLGESLALTVTLQSNSRRVQTLELDYRVHHVKANGELSPKTFKGKQITLQPGQTLVWRKQHPIKPITTRRYYPGVHRVEIQLNGQSHAQADFDLIL